MKRNALSAALLAGTVALQPLAALADNDDWGNRGGNAPGHNGYDGNPYGGYRSVRATGTVAEVERTSLRLDDGRAIFLHQGTVINPTGTTLRPGMRVSISGSPGGRDAINADEIDVSGRNDGGWERRPRRHHDAAGD